MPVLWCFVMWPQLAFRILMLYLTGLAKFVIWTERNKAKFEKKLTKSAGLINIVKSHLRLWVLADFQCLQLSVFGVKIQLFATFVTLRLFLISSWHLVIHKYFIDLLLMLLVVPYIGLFILSSNFLYSVSIIFTIISLSL